MAETPSTLRTLGQLSTVGLSFVLALVLGFGGGYWLDGRLGTRPLLAFLGFFVGVAAGVLNVYRVMQSLAPPPGATSRSAPGRNTASSDTLRTSARSDAARHLPAPPGTSANLPVPPGTSRHLPAPSAPSEGR
jgi:F0F1-type ATP synthase assembly protein I